VSYYIRVVRFGMNEGGCGSLLVENFKKYQMSTYCWNSLTTTNSHYHTMGKEDLEICEYREKSSKITYEFCEKKDELFELDDRKTSEKSQHIKSKILTKYSRYDDDDSDEYEFYINNRPKRHGKKSHNLSKRKLKIKSIILKEEKVESDKLKKSKHVNKQIVDIKKSLNAKHTYRLRDFTLKKELNKLDTLYQNLDKRRNNSEKKMLKLGIRRFNQTAEYKKRFPNIIPKQNLQETPKDKFVLTSLIDTGLSLKEQAAQLIIDLQFRDIQPEDYDVLLLLDDTIQQKVSTNGTVKNLPRVQIENQTCVICFEVINLHENASQLPKCKHIFHFDCITTWLTTASDRCPIDNMVV